MNDTVAPPRWFQVALMSFRTATTVAAMTLLLGLGAFSVLAAPQQPSTSERLGYSAGPLDDLMQANRCSFTGFEPDVIPSTAIIRTPAGMTELVSFDQGWAVFSGEIAGDLVAVCLGPDPAAGERRAGPDVAP